MTHRVLITGANRGLGLEFVRQFLAAGHEVAASARRPAAAGELQALAQEHAALSVHTCDVADQGSVDRLRGQIEARWSGLDRLLNNAGVMGGDGSLAELDLDDLAEVYAINAIGPLRVTRAFLPLLQHGSAPVVTHVTSLMGSIGDNGSGGRYAYRMSKAALNMACRCMMYELPSQGIVNFAIHPGWVQTDMGGASAPLAITESVASIRRVIEGAGPEINGAFVDREGGKLPW